MTHNELESPSCIICEESQSSIIYQPVHNRLAIDETFTIVQCRACQFKYLSPRPTIKSIEKYYDVEEYHPHKISGESLIDKIYLMVRDININAKKKLLTRLCPHKGSLLDVGCGTGEFLDAMQMDGWRVAGMETAKEAKSIATKEGIVVFDDLNDIKETFDIITMWHVLEHIHDIPILMKNLTRLLNDGGIITIAVPNISSLDAKIYKTNWIALDTPRHLYHFTPPDIKKLLEKYNFKLFRISNLLYFDVWYNALLSSQLEAKINHRNFSIFDMLKAGFIAKFSFFNGLFNPSKTSSPVYMAKKL